MNSAPRSPGWAAVIFLVIAGMVASSVATLLVAFGGGWALLASGAVDGPASAQSTDIGSGGDVLEDSWAQTAEVIGPSTVSIQVETSEGAGEGTGVVYRTDGAIVTNAHVVHGATKIQVTTADGQIYTASLVGEDTSTDLAVVQMDNPPADLKPATFADSGELEVGQDVMAMGTPLGLANTATTGIVSALNRPVVTRGGSDDPNDASFTNAIQTDASVNPGNSGGPLVNRAGEVVGINSSIASNAASSQTAGSIGLGFAIPSSTVTLIADQLIETGTAQHALLGVMATDGEVSVEGVGLRGAQIQEVTSGSAAADAGLDKGDVITEVDGVQTGSASALTAYIRSLPVGSTHEITFVRDGSEQTVQVTLQST